MFNKWTLNGMTLNMAIDEEKWQSGTALYALDGTDLGCTSLR